MQSPRYFKALCNDYVTPESRISLLEYPSCIYPAVTSLVRKVRFTAAVIVAWRKKKTSHPSSMRVLFLNNTLWIMFSWQTGVYIAFDCCAAQCIYIYWCRSKGQLPSTQFPCHLSKRIPTYSCICIIRKYPLFIMWHISLSSSYYYECNNFASEKILIRCRFILIE